MDYLIAKMELQVPYDSGLRPHGLNIGFKAIAIYDFRLSPVADLTENGKSPHREYIKFLGQPRGTDRV